MSEGSTNCVLEHSHNFEWLLLGYVSDHMWDKEGVVIVVHKHCLDVSSADCVQCQYIALQVQTVRSASVLLFKCRLCTVPVYCSSSADCVQCQCIALQVQTVHSASVLHFKCRLCAVPVCCSVPECFSFCAVWFSWLIIFCVQSGGKCFLNFLFNKFSVGGYVCCYVFDFCIANRLPSPFPYIKILLEITYVEN